MYINKHGPESTKVECSEEGAWFVEASADQVPKNEGMEPIVQMQVIQSARFLNAVGELARGIEHLKELFPNSDMTSKCRPMGLA
ncbi:hypothetical protein V6N11_077718 [Hibiscus sabdariffa]|uniref:Uncharacterized protein n=1 Tax=Hibiscus sabdariffa TaxID=183260 RepID=A0ABR2TE40_9ROSI